MRSKYFRESQKTFCEGGWNGSVGGHPVGGCVKALFKVRVLCSTGKEEADEDILFETFQGRVDVSSSATVAKAEVETKFEKAFDR